MDRKRKRGALGPSNGFNGQLCDKCSSIFATADNLRKLTSWPGFKHYNELELSDQARGGCTLCILLYDKLENSFEQRGKDTGSLLLMPLSHHGSLALTTTSKSRYPSVVMNTSCLWARWENNGFKDYTFDVVSAQDQRTKLEFPVVPLDYHTNSAIVVAEILKRLKVCQERHICSNNSVSDFPTRVIDVGSATSKKAPHLHISRKDEKGCYAALSYCWGGPQRVTTTSASIHSHKKSLPIRILPRTIKDAINVTKKLGLRYLWIDAFCIIQDDQNDKAEEINAMGMIYQKAIITIAAISAESVEDGFLQSFSRKHSASLAFQLPKGLVANVAVAETSPCWIGGPLDKRAWALQEFYLSQRLLLYGVNGDLRWHCQHDEYAPLFGEKTRSMPRTSQHSSSKRVDSNLNYQFDKLRISQFLPWDHFIERFSMRSITEAEDRLPALAGIVRYMSGILQDDYLAGAWRADLIQQINWSTRPRTTGHPHPCLTAPSWSWASVNRPVYFHTIQDAYQAQVISCAIDPIDRKAPFGQVREGVLKIRALVLNPRKDSASLLSWHNTAFKVTMDSQYYTILGPSEVELVRLGLSHCQWVVPEGSKRLNRFLGIVIRSQGDGTYKRIGVFDHTDTGDANPEVFSESRNSLKSWSVAWEKAVVKEITLL